MFGIATSDCWCQPRAEPHDRLDAALPNPHEAVSLLHGYRATCRCILLPYEALATAAGTVVVIPSARVSGVSVLRTCRCATGSAPAGYRLASYDGRTGTGIRITELCL